MKSLTLTFNEVELLKAGKVNVELRKKIEAAGFSLRDVMSEVSEVDLPSWKERIQKIKEQIKKSGWV